MARTSADLTESIVAMVRLVAVQHGVVVLDGDELGPQWVRRQGYSVFQVCIDVGDDVELLVVPAHRASDELVWRSLLEGWSTMDAALAFKNREQAR